MAAVPRNEAGRQGRRAEGAREHRSEQASRPVSEEHSEQRPDRLSWPAGHARSGPPGPSSGRRLRGPERAHSNVRERGPQQPTHRSAAMAGRVTERTLALTGEGPPNPPNGGKRAGPCPGQIWVRLRHLLRRVSGPLRLYSPLRAPCRSWAFCRPWASQRRVWPLLRSRRPRQTSRHTTPEWRRP
jgi:hypothetical protein